MRFTRPRDLITAAGITGVLIFLALQQFWGDLPPLPRLAGITLAALALIETALGFSLRSRIERRSERPVQPLTVARAVALAKASSLLGAIMLGAWLAALIYLMPQSWELARASQDLPSTVIGLVCAAALIGGALWLEYCCRTPHDEDEPREP